MNLDIIETNQILLLLVYFVLGYLLYAGVFVAVGAPATTEHEAQQLSGYLTLFLIVPIVLAFPAIQDPNSTWVRILTFIPLLTPTIMALRVPIQMPEVWEIIGSVALLGLSAWGMMWVAAKIFRVGILAYGKRPTVSELMHWLKAA